MAFSLVKQIPGMYAVDYVMSRHDGGPGADECVAVLKNYGIHAEAVATNAPAVSAVVVRRLDKTRAVEVLRGHYHEDPPEPWCERCEQPQSDCICDEDEE